MTTITIPVEFIGELAQYVESGRIEVVVKVPSTLTEVMHALTNLLSKPCRNMLVTGTRLRAVVIVNGVVETNYSRTILGGDRIALALPVEGG